jgi:hypothetical protein
VADDLPPIVFVLGAGASWGQGLPLGNELAKQIATRDGLQGLYASLDLSQSFEHLQTAMKKIGHSTIDKLLRSQKRFWEVGRRAIAYEILLAEKNGTGDERRISDQWYSQLFEFLSFIADGDFGVFAELPVRFITFNYDRTFDNYWWDALTLHFSEIRINVLNYLQTHPIIHMYGQAGKLSWQLSDRESVPAYEVPFGVDTSPAMVNRAAEALWIVHDKDLEDPVKAPHIAEAKTLIQNAAAIWFLGFRFDEDNFVRLGMLPGSQPELFYTAFNEPEHERQRITDMLEHRSAYVGATDEMTARFFNRTWSLFTRNIATGWGKRRRR